MTFNGVRKLVRQRRQKLVLQLVRGTRGMLRVAQRLLSMAIARHVDHEREESLVRLVRHVNRLHQARTAVAMHDEGLESDALAPFNCGQMGARILVRLLAKQRGHVLTDQLVATGAEPFFVAAIHEAISALSVHVGNERGNGIDQNLQLGFARAEAYLELVLRTDVHVHAREADDRAGVAQRCGVLSNPHLAFARRPGHAKRRLIAGAGGECRAHDGLVSRAIVDVNASGVARCRTAGCHHRA